ncbi:DUF6182 family protein [Streptomyces sp. NPDC101227]|uniref:DUF6182 family protein n=1 Tax=Streptomyces sp. NPDC101227 TaxID=3366136 RepID=UPI00380156A5
MPLSADRLLSLAAERLHTARPELAGRHDLSTPAALRAVKAEIAGATDPARTTEAVVVAVVGELDLIGWVRETCAFTCSLTAEHREAWRRSFTRTVYLAGSPENLRGRFPFDHIAPDGSAAWLGPAPAAASHGLRRLLKSFDGRRALGDLATGTVELRVGPGPRSRPPRHRVLQIVTAGLTLTDALVHLNHLLAEAVMDGLIAPGDRITVRGVPRLDESSGPFAALRIDTAHDSPDRLQAFAGLTQEIPDAVPHHR